MPQKREMMRIIAGKYKRRLIYWPEDISIRPTKDRIRESVFAILNDITNKVFLDLYAGSGSMGLEAISRGAKKVFFVDKGVPAIKCIKENIKLLDIKEDYEVLKLEDVEAIQHFINEGIKFDIIYLDPPYKLGQYEDIVISILRNNILLPHGIIITESDRPLVINEERIQYSKQYKYGEIYITLFGA